MTGMTYFRGEIPLIDLARYDFKKHGKDFDLCRQEIEEMDKGYYFSGPDFLMMGWHDKGAWGCPTELWVVFYARTKNGYNLGDLFKMMPYELPHIGFMRGMQGKKDLKYYPWEHLHKLCKMSGNSIGG